MTAGVAERTAETVASGDDVVVEDAVLSAAKSESKATVPSQTAESNEARAWDARAQID